MTISIYQLKPRFQRLLAPLLRMLAATGITPNQVTLAAMVLSLAYGAALAWSPYRTALQWGMPLMLLLRMALNAIDGMLATATGRKTRLGALLNELADQLSDAGLYLPFAMLPGVSAMLVVPTVVLGLMAEFAGVLAVSVGAPRGFEGPMGKSDRAFGFGLLALLIAADVDALWLNALLLVMMLLSSWTIVNRMHRALRFSAPSRP